MSGEKTKQTIFFLCPVCRQHLEVDNSYALMDIECPSCTGAIQVPESGTREQYAAGDRPELVDGGPGPDGGGSPLEAVSDSGVVAGSAGEPEPAAPVVEAATEEGSWREDVAELAAMRPALQSNIERGGMTISRFMAERQIEGGVNLDGSDTSVSAASGILTDEQGHKYELGAVVAQGGMGAIIEAKDANIRRQVAMKVMLNPQDAEEAQVLRFIEEAQVTGQLEHPSIVPVYELGVDATGNVFYTMKFVRGQTLKDILKKIHEGDTATLAEYPLSHLLNIFQKVCDAMAFAHSKRVIHRDLKPENIMVGEYGEVQVMDWGLAKVLPKKVKKRVVVKGRGQAASRETEDLAVLIDSVRKGAGGDMHKTMDGSIMGTPGYMAPEQAMGQLDKIDECSDIYALGAILYAILTLQPPIKGKTIEDFLTKVSAGVITPPTEFGKKPAKRTGTRKPAADGGAPDAVAAVELKHLPAGLVPESLGAVAMKALALKPISRYQRVKDLQKDIEAYQDGFATSAEKAGLGKQLALLIGRHKGVSIAAAVILVLVIAGSIASTSLWLQADRQRVRAEQKEAEATAATKSLRETAPDLVTLARQYLEEGKPAEALKRIRFAVVLADERADYWLLKANMLQSFLQLEEAAIAYREVLARDPGNKAAAMNLELCRKFQSEQRSKGGYPVWVVIELYKELRAQERYTESLELARHLGGQGGSLASYYKGLFQNQGFSPSILTTDSSGTITELELSGRGDLRDLRRLAGLPIVKLGIGSCPVNDLSPLKGMPLTSLNANGTVITDLSPLRGMRLVSLSFGGTLVTDLSPLKGMPITNLNASVAGVGDLTSLIGMPLTGLSINGSQVSDLSPLKDMRLTSLEASGNKLSSVSVLQGMPLTRLNLNGQPVGDLSPLRSMRLEWLNIGSARVNDLSILQGMPLTWLGIDNMPVSDLSPLKNMMLKMLSMNGCTQVSDLSPLKGMPLVSLNINGTKVADLSPLRDMPLTSLAMHRCAELRDISPLRGMPLKSLQFPGAPVSDISVIRGMQVNDVWLPDTVVDLSPLEGLKLNYLRFTPSPDTKGLGVIRNMTTLASINDTNPSNFWAKCDAGEFAKK